MNWLIGLSIWAYWSTVYSEQDENSKISGWDESIKSIAGWGEGRSLKLGRLKI